ncbi:galectin-2-like [Rhinoraja longicauda]
MDPGTIMDTEMTLYDVGLAPRSSVEIRGKVREVSERFQIDIGRDTDNIALHFNPRFEGYQHAVAINSRQRGNWQGEVKTSEFPFKRGDDFKVLINFDGDEFDIVSQDGHSVKFPNRLGDNVFNYLKVNGNIDLHFLKMTH